MGKTLGAILLVAAAIAVNFIPGVGQFISGQIFGALATITGTTGLLASAALTLSQVALAGLTVAGLSAAGGLLGLGPASPKPNTSETPLKTPRPPRVSAYGRSRLYGAYVLFETDSTGQAIDHYAVHDGAIDAIEYRYLNDDSVTVVSTVVQEGDDGRYRDGFLFWYETLGETPGGAGGWPAATLIPDQWDATSRGDGVVALGIYARAAKAKDFSEIYPQSGVPMPSIVARWQKCPDPEAADPLNVAAWTWTENPVRQLMHYKIVREGPRPALPESDAGYAAALADLREAYWERRFAPTLDYWIAAAQDCDEARALNGGGTEAKYRSNVAHSHNDEHKGPVAALLATFDGWLCTRADGAFVIHSGVYYEPTVDIGPDEIVAYAWEGAGVDDDMAVNEIICSYLSSEHDFTVVECDAWRDEADISARGDVLSAPLDAQVPSHAQARYLAKRIMRRKNALNRGSVTTNIAGRAVRAERFINLRLEEAGAVFYDGPAEVIALTRNLRGGVTFQWVEADPTVDDWNPATEEGEPAATSDRVESVALDAPEITDAEPTTTESSVRFTLTVTGPDREDLTWYAHWRVVGEAIWSADAEYPDVDPGATVSLLTEPLPGSETIEIEVSYLVADGRRSPWSVPFELDTEPVEYDGGDATGF